MLISKCKPLPFIFFIVMISLPVSHVLAQPEPVILKSTINKYTLGLDLEFLEDNDLKWTIQDVTSDKLSKQFVKSKKQTPTFGFTESAYWIRFTVKNSIDKNSDLYLELDYPLMDQIDLYIPQKNDQYIRRKAGDHFPILSREIKHRNVVFLLTVSAKEQKTYYLRFSTQGSMIISPILWSQPAFVNKVMVEQILLGLFYGIILVMILYNLFLFLAIKDNSYLYYVIFIFAVMMTYLSLDGIAFQYLPFSLGYWINNNLSFTVLFNIIWIMQFGRSFLNITKQDIALYRTIWAFTFLSLALMVISLFVSYHIIIQPVAFSTMLTTSIATAAGVIRLRQGYKPARYYLLAWVTFLFGVALYSMRAFGIVPDNAISANMAKIGSVLEVILLSLALGDRINLMRQEKEHAEKVLQKEKIEAKIRHETEKVKAVQEVRQKISVDLHDRLGAELTDLKLTFEKQIQKEKPGKKSSGLTLARINKSISLLRTEMINLDDLNVLTNNFMQGVHIILVRRYSAIERPLKFKMDAKLENKVTPFDSQKLSSLYSILMEVITNDLKYGNDVAYWHLNLKNSQLTISMLAKTQYDENNIYSGKGSQNIKDHCVAMKAEYFQKIRGQHFVLKIVVPTGN